MVPWVQEAQPLPVRRQVDLLGAVGPVEEHRVDAVLTFDGVAAVAGIQTNVSWPLPNSATSLPPFPSIESPLPPSSVSAPEPPARMSFPLSPRSVPASGSSDQVVVSVSAVDRRRDGVGEDAVARRCARRHRRSCRRRRSSRSPHARIGSRPSRRHRRRPAGSRDCRSVAKRESVVRIGSLDRQLAMRELRIVERRLLPQCDALCGGVVAARCPVPPRSLPPPTAAIAAAAETANSTGRTARESWSRMKFLMASFRVDVTCLPLETPVSGVYSRAVGARPRSSATPGPRDGERETFTHPRHEIVDLLDRALRSNGDHDLVGRISRQCIRGCPGGDRRRRTSTCITVRCSRATTAPAATPLDGQGLVRQLAPEKIISRHSALRVASGAGAGNRRWSLAIRVRWCTGRSSRRRRGVRCPTRSWRRCRRRRRRPGRSRRACRRGVRT